MGVYRADVNDLPQEVLDALTELHAALLLTDFEHVQLTFNFLREPDKFNQTLHYIAATKSKMTKDKNGTS